MGGGVEDLNCTRLFSKLINKANIFPVEKLCMIQSLSNMICFLALGCLQDFFPKISSPPPLFPQESNGPRLRKTDTFRTKTNQIF